MADSAPSDRRGGAATVPVRHHDRRHGLRPPRGAEGRRGASRSISLLMGRRLMRSSAPAVRDTATVQLEEMDFEWGYSKPVVALDAAWNLAFVLVAASVLLSSARERPSTPIRAWVFGYALQCFLHVGFICFEYRRRRRHRRSARRGDWWLAAGDGDGLEESRENRALMKLESLNALASIFWWMLGFYWIVVGRQTLIQDAPSLYWLTVVFLAFDVFFAIFCVMLACMIGIALCYCLPCFLVFLYAVSNEEGASDADLRNLPKFHFRRTSKQEKHDVDEDNSIGYPTGKKGQMVADLALPLDDSECCICLSHYEDGVELHSLPCKHHFHSDCIVKWLRINATCPLCKYNILNADELV